MRELALQALQAALRDDWDDGVQRAFDELNTDGEALLFALVAWCDWLIQAQAQMQGVEVPAAGPVPGFSRPGWLNMGTRRGTLNADEVPREARWAGQLIAARAAMDQPQFTALITALPDDSLEAGEHVSTLLWGCAGMVGMSARRLAGRRAGSAGPDSPGVALWLVSAQRRGSAPAVQRGRLSPP
jgi:hypothetical protein